MKPTIIFKGDRLRQRSLALLTTFLIGGCESWQAARQRNIDAMFEAACGTARDTAEYRSCIDDHVESSAPD